MNDEQRGWAHEVTDILDRLPHEVAKLVPDSRAAPGSLPVIAHFRCPDPRLCPRISSGSFIRPRSRANFLRR